MGYRSSLQQVFRPYSPDLHRQPQLQTPFPARLREPTEGGKELRREHVTGQSGNYQISLKGYMYVYRLLLFKEHHLWNERSEQSVRELADPTQKSRYEHQWHWRAVKIYQRHNNPLHLVLSANIVDIVIKNHRHHKLSYCHHLNANATRPMMVEVKPKRQRG